MTVPKNDPTGSPDDPVAEELIPFMCLAVPGRIVALEGNRATVELAGNTLQADVSLIERPAVGDWVVVHAGFALERVDERAALETLALARELTSASRDGGRSQ